MFRASNAHLQEDIVVYMQHMVLSLCKQVSGPPEDEHLMLETYTYLLIYILTYSTQHSPS